MDIRNIYILLTLVFFSVVASNDKPSNDKPTILIIGASGAIGSSLTRHLLEQGHPVIAGLRRSPLPSDIAKHPLLTSSFGVDCTDENSIVKVFASNPSISIVWNLAAPLSVETASMSELSERQAKRELSECAKHEWTNLPP